MKEEKYRLVMMMGMYLAILLLTLTCYILITNIKEIKTDPIVYGVEKKGFVICSCYDAEGISYDYNATGIVLTKQYGYNFNFQD